MKPIRILLLFCMLLGAACSSQSSTESFKDDLDFTIKEVEYNYAGFPLPIGTTAEERRYLSNADDSFYPRPGGPGIDDQGIVPDVRVNWRPPGKLTDNIDSWVKRIAKELEKQ